jgi:hypothetical protein
MQIASASQHFHHRRDRSRIIQAALQGERDPVRLHAKALSAFDLEETCKSVAA